MAVTEWSSPDWLNEVTEWVQQRVDEKGLALAGALEPVRTGMTATVFRVPTTTQGHLYFKAITPPCAYEVVLHEKLTHWHPRDVPALYGFNTERHWLLMADAGQTLRERTKATADFMSWKTMLILFGNFQRGTRRYINEMLKIGVPDRRLDKLPGLYTTMLDDEKTLLVGKPGGFTPDEVKQMRDFAPQVADMCAQLASFNIDDGLHHDDFHDGNIACGPGKNYLYFDWGECAVAQPFFSMMILLRVVKLMHKKPNLLNYYTDEYLRQWTQSTPLTALYEPFALAQRLAVLCRALTWQYVLSTHTLTEEEWADSGDSAAYWLRMFVEYETSAER